MPQGPFGGRRPFAQCTPAIKITGRRAAARNFTGLDRAEFEADVAHRLERSDIDNRPEVKVTPDVNKLFVMFPNQEIHPDVPEKVRQEIVKKGKKMSPKLRPKISIVAL